MLYGTINEQGHRLGVRYDVSEKVIFSHVSYKCLASGAVILGKNSLLIIKPIMDLLSPTPRLKIITSTQTWYFLIYMYVCITNII